jgi:hypothetical protein
MNYGLKYKHVEFVELHCFDLEVNTYIIMKADRIEVHCSSIIIIVLQLK